MFAGLQESDGDGKVVGGTLFAQIAGGKIDGDPLEGKEQSRILDGRPHALATLVHGGIGESHDHKEGTPVRNIHLNLDGDAVETENRAGGNLGKHRAIRLQVCHPGVPCLNVLPPIGKLGMIHNWKSTKQFFCIDTGKGFRVTDDLLPEINGCVLSLHQCG